MIGRPLRIVRVKSDIELILRDVRYWHLADMTSAPQNVRFWG